MFYAAFYRKVAKLSLFMSFPAIYSNVYYHFIQISVSVRCYSHVGKQNLLQLISLGSGCEAVEIALHEMVHTLGFFHTSSRTDRDSYVIVYENNIEPGRFGYFYSVIIFTYIKLK